MGLAATLGNASHEENSRSGIAFRRSLRSSPACLVSRGLNKAHWDPSPPSRPTPAARLIKQNCAGCHAADLSGIGNALPLSGLPVHRQLGKSHRGRSGGFHGRRDASQQSRRAGRAELPEHHRVYPAIERRASRESGARREFDRRHSQRDGPSGRAGSRRTREAGQAGQGRTGCRRPWSRTGRAPRA